MVQQNVSFDRMVVVYLHKHAIYLNILRLLVSYAVAYLGPFSRIFCLALCNGVDRDLDSHYIFYVRSPSTSLLLF